MSLDKANFDPFVGAQAPAPQSAPQPSPPLAVQAAPPPPPAPPPLSYRYVGRMVDPSGRQFVYLGKSSGGADGSGAVAVAVGTQLDEGYVVEAIGADSVSLRYPPLDMHAVIDIPQAAEASPP